MDARIGDKCRVPNRHVTDGTSRAQGPAYLELMPLKRELLREPLACVACRPRDGRPAPKGGASRDSAPEDSNVATVTIGIAMAHRGTPRQGTKPSPGLPEADRAPAAKRRSAAKVAEALDFIVLEPAEGPIDIHLGDAEPAERRQNYSVHKTESGFRALWAHAPHVRPAVTAAAHPGASEEIHVHADI